MRKETGTHVPSPPSHTHFQNGHLFQNIFVENKDILNVMKWRRGSQKLAVVKPRSSGLSCFPSMLLPSTLTISFPDYFSFCVQKKSLGTKLTIHYYTGNSDLTALEPFLFVCLFVCLFVYVFWWWWSMTIRLQTNWVDCKWFCLLAEWRLVAANEVCSPTNKENKEGKEVKAVLRECGERDALPSIRWDGFYQIRGDQETISCERTSCGTAVAFFVWILCPITDNSTYRPPLKMPHPLAFCMCTQLQRIQHRLLKYFISFNSHRFSPSASRS